MDGTCFLCLLADEGEGLDLETEGGGAIEGVSLYSRLSHGAKVGISRDMLSPYS